MFTAIDMSVNVEIYNSENEINLQHIYKNV